MRNLLYLALLVPILALAAANSRPLTAIAPENGITNATLASTPVPAPGHKGQLNIPSRALVGSVDTIGGTIYDWWTNGPRLRELVNSPGHGVHALWMYSDQVYQPAPPESFPDRNMWYNFYDYTSHTWNWLDPDFMKSGAGVFPHRAGYGNIDAESSGAAIVSAHLAQGGGSTIVPWVAKDGGPGYAIFNYADTLDLGAGQWPPIAVNGNNTINILPMTNAYAMSYSHILPDSWPKFSTPISLPNPGWITQNITASKVSSKVAAVWSTNATVPGLQEAYVDYSTDEGVTWSGDSLLALPAAYGGDTVTSCHLTGLFPWYDRQDRFHIVTNLMPMLNDTGRVIPSQIWHYCPNNTPQWNRIHIASVDSADYIHDIGYNATLACRPTIGQDDDGNLFVAWEQFDTLNYDSTTSYARADIYAALSSDNGVSWGEAVKLTDAGSYSMRFPSVIDQAVEGGAVDTMLVLYEEDSVAGFVVEGQGPVSKNPVVVQKVPISAIGVTEQESTTPSRFEVTAEPNPFGGRTRISYALPKTGDVSLVVYDAVGRPVQTLASGRRAAGRYTATWDARGAAAGIYFCTLESGRNRICHKVVVTR